MEILTFSGVDFVQKIEAKSYIRDKILWIVPSWICNRGNDPCKICFATDIMSDAKEKGYVSATEDLLEKASVITKLPWKEVILTGGEPFNDSNLLEKTLNAIDSKRLIRIVTNGDWILDDNKFNKRIEILKKFGDLIQVDISAHNDWNIFKKKLKKIFENDIHVGVQLRFEEDNFRQKYDYLEKFRGRVSIEVHHALGLGYANTNKDNGQSSTDLDLWKLVGYTDRKKNVGMYLMPGRKGTRIVGNHETPYLVHETPADIAKPTDSATEAVKKIIQFYSQPGEMNITSELDENVSKYALAAFKANTPVNLGEYLLYEVYPDALNVPDENKFTKQAKVLMDGYLEIIAENNNTSVKEVRAEVKINLAKTMISMLSSGSSFVVADLYNSIIQSVAQKIPHTPIELSAIVGQDLLNLNDLGLLGKYYLTKFTNEQISKSVSLDSIKGIEKHFRIKNLEYGFQPWEENNRRALYEFDLQLKVLGTSKEEIFSIMKDIIGDISSLEPNAPFIPFDLMKKKLGQ